MTEKAANTSTYQIDCHACDQVVNLVKAGDDFHCPTCDTKYEWEDGVIDVEYAADMYRLYKGAKLAGLIPDPDTQEEFYHG